MKFWVFDTASKIGWERDLRRKGRGREKRRSRRWQRTCETRTDSLPQRCSLKSSSSTMQGTAQFRYLSSLSHK